MIQEQDKMQYPKIAFGVLSCRDSAAAVTQLANAVYPHRVIVHHDFSKHYDFDIERPNVIILPQPLNTAWAGWSLVEACALLMQEEMRDPQCTHFQLLSESCLPIRSIKDFESYLAATQPDAMIDLELLTNPGSDILLSHGWRYLTRSRRAMRIAMTSRSWWLGSEKTAQQMDSC